MYTAHTSALPFKDYRLQSQVPTNVFTSWRPGTNHTQRMRIGPSLQRKGPGREMPPLQAPNRRPPPLSKFILVPALCSHLTIAYFTASMFEWQDKKIVILSAYMETFARWSPTKEIPCKAGFTPSSQSLRKRGHREEGIRDKPTGPTAWLRKAPSASRLSAPLPEGCDTAC